MLLFELTVIKYIPAVMGMMLRTGLIGKSNVFHLKHPLSMLNMYCILELRDFLMVISNSPLLPAIFAITGTVLGAVIGIIPHYFREKSADKAFRKNKLEELYYDINNWINFSFFIPIINFYLVFKKEIDWNGYLKIISESEPSKHTKFFKSEIILNLYFKELIPDFNKLTEAFQNTNRFINNEIKTVYLAGGEILVLKPEFDAKVKDITGLAENLKEKIKIVAQRI